MYLDVDELATEVMVMLDSIDLENQGERLISNFQLVTSFLIRLQEVHNQIAMEEIYGRASPELRKFRTMVLDPTVDRFEKVANFESRKITAHQIELQLDR